MKFNFVIGFLLFVTLVSSQADEDIVFEDEPQPLLIQQQTVPETSQPVQTPQSRKFQFNQQTLFLYRYELAAIVAILVYLIMYRRGRSHNSSLIESFYRKTHTYFEENFAHIGFTRTHKEDPFVAQSANQAMFYASGRNNVDYVEINFNMRKRQDLLYYLIYEIIYPQKDMITVDIPVQTQIPLVFALANKKKLKTVTEKHLDLSQLTGTFEVKNLHQNLHILGESMQTIDFIIDNYVVKRVNELSNMIMSIHYTDQKMFSEQSGHLRAIFYASKKNEEKYRTAIELLFYIVERIIHVKISNANKQKALKSREVFNASKEKQALERHKEQLKKQKEDKKRKEEAWLRSLPPEKQKREDEKRKKKEMNKMIKGKTMKVM